MMQHKVEIIVENVGLREKIDPGMSLGEIAQQLNVGLK